MAALPHHRTGPTVRIRNVSLAQLIAAQSIQKLAKSLAKFALARLPERETVRERQSVSEHYAYAALSC